MNGVGYQDMLSKQGSDPLSTAGLAFLMSCQFLGLTSKY